MAKLGDMTVRVKVSNEVADLQLERRFTTSEVRAVADPSGDSKKIVGYAATFNTLTEDMGGWRETILPGAFSEVLRDDVRALFNHDPNYILGRTPRTLRLVEDSLGLRYEIDPPGAQYAQDLLESLERGDIDQSSFAFYVKEHSWEEPTEDRPYLIRKIHKFARLFDVSPVTFPANPTTSAEARDYIDRILSPRGAPGGNEDIDDGKPGGPLGNRKRRLQLIESEV